MDPAEGERRGEDGHISRAQRVDGTLIAVEAEELAVVRNIHLRADGAFLQGVVAAVELVLEDIGHRDQLDRAFLDVQRVVHRSAAATAAADQRDLDGLAVLRVNVREGDARERGDGGDLAGSFEEITTRRGGG